MQLLRVVANFGADIDTQKQIYIHIIRAILEGSCVVWDRGLTKKNRRSLKIILPNLKYKQALKQLDIEDLQTRRTMITLRFSKLNQKSGKLTTLFKKSHKLHIMKTRNLQKYNTTANTNRYKRSPILHMKKILTNTIKN